MSRETAHRITVLRPHAPSRKPKPGPLHLGLAALLLSTAAIDATGVEPPNHARTAGVVRAGTPATEDIARARTRPERASFPIEEWGQAAFDRARREHRLVLVDGAAAWCHWCHVMDETTYRDPRVVELIGARFVFVRFDVDARPDLGDRYESTGWPAIVLLTPDGAELGRHQGFIEAEGLLSILAGVSAARESSSSSAPLPAPLDALPWIGRQLALALDQGWDEQHGGWGGRKFPRPANALFELLRAEHGDDAALTRARRALAGHARLLDPVWGGIWKGNAAADWSHPHVEKQTIYQGQNMEAFARGYRVTRDAALLAAARTIDRYLAAFLTSPDGALFAAQDADVGAHDRAARFVDGAVYYGWSDARRRAAGLPWVDTHVYARENGLAISGLAALYLATHDEAVLARARRAAAYLQLHVIATDGSVAHDAASPTGRRFLADAAALGLGLSRLGNAAHDATLLASARRIATAIDRDFADPTTGALYDATFDASAGGAFARRDTPLEAATWAARLYAEVAADSGDVLFRDRGRRAIAAIATPERLAAEGYVVGDLLLALDELGDYRWPTAAQPAKRP